jgi:uncharacterized membrane-anchored protein YhcB (DUF1043 family)
MEMLNTMVEAVFISFLIGAILGGVTVAHFVTRSQAQDESENKLQPVKIRSDRNDS